jgi:hypothetical protein
MGRDYATKITLRPGRDLNYLKKKLKQKDDRGLA